MRTANPDIEQTLSDLLKVVIGEDEISDDSLIVVARFISAERSPSTNYENLTEIIKLLTDAQQQTSDPDEIARLQAWKQRFSIKRESILNWAPYAYRGSV